MSGKRFIAAGLCVIFCFLSGCAGMNGSKTLPPPENITAPEPISDNSGKYMCPYTQDDVVAPWVSKAISAKTGSAVGATAGAYAGQKAFEQIPLIGGLLGKEVGGYLGKEVAIKMCGGWEYIKSTSDLSFNTVEDMALWLYATKSSNEHYEEVIQATGEIYPEFQKRYLVAIEGSAKE